MPEPAAESLESAGIAPGSDLYYSFVFEAAGRRQPLEAAAGLGASLVQVAEQCTDPGVARVKLGWWREELGRLARGQARHPLTRALQGPEGPAAAAALDEVAAAVERGMMLGGGTTEAALAAYCEGSDGRLWALLATLAGRAHAAPACTRLGGALARQRLLLDTRADLQRGWLRLPVEWLQAQGLEAADLCDRPESAEVRAAMLSAVAALRQEFDACASALEQSRAPLCATVAAALQQVRMRELERAGGRVLEQRVALTPLRRLWVAWRTRRRHR